MKWTDNQFLSQKLYSMKNLRVTLGLFVLLLSIVSWYACNQDPMNFESRLVDVAFAGRIIDESGAPVADAQVQAGTQTVTTDDNGVFRTKKVQMPDNDAILSVNKDGYFEFSRAYYVKDEALQTVTIQLIKKVQVGSFDNATGGTVNIPGGPTLKFPANSVNTSGNIRVFARYLNPQDDQLALFCPGDFRGIGTSGNEQALGSFGMVAVELEGAGGKAQIADGMEVELTMPITSVQASQAPSDIPLWHFDVVKSRWIEEGSAQKNGNQYVGKVKHFSFWNCDVGLSLVQLNGSVYLDDLQHPLPFVTIELIATNTSWPGYANTDQNGQFGGGVIQGVEMQMNIQLYGQCGNQVLYTQTIGPFNSSTTLPPIIISSSSLNTPTFTGNIVNCAGNPVSNGYVRIGNNIVFADENGAFSYTILNCNNLPSIQVQAFDLDNLKESPVQTVTIPTPGGVINVGTLTACIGLDEYIQSTIDGQTLTVPEPDGYSIDSIGFASINLYGGFGTTSYISLQFSATQAGTYPLEYFSNPTVGLSGAAAAGIITNLTNFPANPGEYFIGTFSGTYLDEQGATHTVSGSYRVKRE